MTILQILILAIVAVLVNRLKKGRSLALLGSSAFVIYWLQPNQEPVSLMFWLPTLTLGIIVMSWLITSIPEKRSWRENQSGVIVLVAVVLFVDLNHYFKMDVFFVVETPRIQWVFVLLLGLSVFALVLSRVRKFPSFVFTLSLLIIIALLAFVKTPSALATVLEKFAEIRGKDPSEAVNFSWLGFSYVAFRLLHTVIDRNTGRLPPVSLTEYVNYVIFFPAFTAGPIDRLERFVSGLSAPMPLDVGGWVEASQRIFVGLFKKFVIADALVWIALNETFVRDAKSAGWLWTLLYAFSLRIYFDFSGYTDIAIGLGRLLGVRLPENFDSPYFKPNLTQFWNSWHMTLTQWFRSYFFNPLTRAVRSAENPLSPWLMIFFSQVATMLLIGLWHGVTINFVLWGLWHGCGLFIQNRWSEFVRTRMINKVENSSSQLVLRFTGMFLTFNFVSLGWLFFALPSAESVWSAALKLFGVM